MKSSIRLAASAVALLNVVVVYWMWPASSTAQQQPTPKDELAEVFSPPLDPNSDEARFQSWQNELRSVLSRPYSQYPSRSFLERTHYVALSERPILLSRKSWPPTNTPQNAVQPVSERPSTRWALRRTQVSGKALNPRDYNYANVFEVVRESPASREGNQGNVKVPFRFTVLSGYSERFVRSYSFYNGDLFLLSEKKALVVLSQATNFSMKVQVFEVDLTRNSTTQVPPLNKVGKFDWRYRQVNPVPTTAFKFRSEGTPFGVVFRQATATQAIFWVFDGSYPNYPRSFRYDFKTKKWSEVLPTKAELAARKKLEEQKEWMDEYRDRREIFGLTKERATAAVRARSGIKDWEPLKEAWDTPDLKSKRYWLTPTPAPTPTSTPAPASAAPVPAAPVPPAP